MNPSPIADTFGDAEKFGFLPVPIAVPPMIEQAFHYRGRGQYVTLGFGVHGGVMTDMVKDAEEPEPADLYRKMLLHRVIKPHTDAFQIDLDPPGWLQSMQISEFDQRRDEFAIWSNKSRCLLLDREIRRFLVGSVTGVRDWLLLRGALYRGRRVRRSRIEPSPEMAVQKLFAWLDQQTPEPVSAQFLAEWESRFQERQAVAACTAAAFSLGFKDDDVRSLMHDVFQNRER
jgi:hypothetical protein